MITSYLPIKPLFHTHINQAPPCLASEVRWDQGRSGWYDCRLSHSSELYFTCWIFMIFISDLSLWCPVTFIYFSFVVCVPIHLYFLLIWLILPLSVTLWLSFHNISLSPLLPCHLLLLSYALVALVGLFIDVYFHEIHYLVEFSRLWIKCVWNVFWVKNVKWRKCFSKVSFLYLVSLFFCRGS